MKASKTWLDQLPLDSHERQLLEAGKAEHPPRGAVDQGWQELRIALGGAATASALASSKAAATTATSASSALAGKAAGSGLGAVVYAKSVAIGCAVALSVLGGGRWVYRLAEPSVARPPVRQEPAVEPTARVAPARSSSVSSLDSVAPSSEPVSADTAPKKPKAPAPEAAAAPATAGTTPTPTLAEQARELAQIKRLLDAGDTSSALRRLETSFAERAHGQLSEERDALLVQAVEKSGDRERAGQLARQFLARYPNSPQRGKMRALAP